MSKTMKAAVFVAPGGIELVDHRVPDLRPMDALARVTNAITS
jgi:hypothetical protein